MEKNSNFYNEERINIWVVRTLVLVFFVLNFHVIGEKNFKLDWIGLSELAYIGTLVLIFILSKAGKFPLNSKYPKLMFDFFLVTFFEILSLKTMGNHSMIYVLYLIPIIYCSYWFNIKITTIFVIIVSLTYSMLNYHMLKMSDKFDNWRAIVRILSPGVIIFIIVAYGVIYYNRKIQKKHREKESLAELKREENYTRRLLKSSFDAFISVDEKGNIIDANERSLDLLGYKKEEMISFPVKSFYAPGEATRIMRKLRETGSIENFETSILNSRGEAIPILLSASLLYDEDLNLKNALTTRIKFSSIGYFRDRRIDEAVDEIAKDLTSAVDEITILAKIVEVISKKLRAEACCILTYNGVENVLKVVSCYGMPVELQNRKHGEEYRDVNDGMTGKVFFSGKSLNLSNINVKKQEPTEINIKWEYAKNFDRYSRFRVFKHFLGIPLYVQGEVYGVIRVLNKYKNDKELDSQGFTSNDQKILERIAAHYSVLVEKVRDKERLEAISTVGREINEMVDKPIEDLLDKIVERVVKGMNYRACYLRLIEDSDILKIKACFGLINQYKGDKEFDLKVGTGICGKVAETGKYYVAEDLENEKEFEFTKILEVEGLKSLISVPLKYRDQIIGVINCYTCRIHKFSDQEIRIMKTFADYASTAIQNKKQIEELLYALNDIGSELVKPVDIEKLLDLILARAKAISGANCLCIKTVNEQTRELKIERSLNCEWHDKNKDEKSHFWEGDVDEIITKGESKIIMYNKEYRDRLKNVKDKELLYNIKTSAMIPIKIDNKIYSIVFLDSFKENFFTNENLLLFKAFSIQAAIALRNANFFNKLQRVTKTYPQISELHVDINRVLSNIAEIAAEVLETDVLVLYRYDEKEKKIIWPPIYKGVLKQPKFMVTEVDASDAPMYFINKKLTHYAEDSQHDMVMAPSQIPREGIPKRFLFRENIVSSAGILLTVGQDIEGIMFINYRTHHQFNSDEKKIIELFASYIAIAIRNVRHFSEKEISSAMQTLGKLAAVIAHKIKNDISTISLYAEDLLEETEKKDPHYINIKNILEKVNKITIDINYYLAASKLKKYEIATVDINDILRGIELETYSDLEKRKIKMILTTIDTLPLIKADFTLIKIVLSNLIYNAMDAMPKGGILSIAVASSEGMLILELKDTGIGISQENMNNIFQPFWTSKGKGFGLGLFLSKIIIEEHGGTISLDSKYNEGAKFIIKFPISKGLN